MPKPDELAPGGFEASVSRRSFFKSVGTTAAVSTLGAAGQAASAAIDAPDDDPVRGPGPIAVSLTINGEAKRVEIEACTTLLEALRLHVGLTGSKEICDRGSCGGCSVLVDGKLVTSCMMLAVDAEGARVTTIEGLAKDGSLTPLQESFVRHDALQCGYCTPGLVIASKALLDEHPKPTLDQIKHGLCGNICRCGTYTNIFNAVLEASGQAPLVDPLPG